MAKRMIIMLIAVGVVFGAVFGFEAFRASAIKKFLAAHGSPAQTVSTMKAAVEAWKPQLEAVGSLRAVNGANLSAQVSGIVSAIHFQSGSDVEKGALLLELMDADDIAKLRSLQANAALAQITYERDLKQFRAQAVSQQTIDVDEQNLKSLQAQVAEQQATVDYKRIRAPFSGHLGIRQVDLGQYLSAGTTIVTLQALDPIFVDFTLPQQALDKIKPGLPVTISIDTYPGQTFSGTITAVSPLIDTSTRNVQIRATIKNPDHKLLPGMFATVDIETGTPQRYITLPQTAIAFNPYGDTVYLVEQSGTDAQGKPELVAHQSFVTVGPTRGDQIAVLTGVKAGDTVVTSGQIKLRNGTRLIINNSVQPPNNPNPNPAEE